MKKVENINNPTIGVYRLSMKKNSDNFRNASILDIINILDNNGYNILIYDSQYQGKHKVSSLNEFLTKSDLIIANRISKELECVKDKLYTRDLTNKD